MPCVLEHQAIAAYVAERATAEWRDDHRRGCSEYQGGLDQEAVHALGLPGASPV
jgi:hypothetical protein